MSVTSYLPGKDKALKMPKSHGGVDSLGIKWHGAVLQGKLSTNQAFALDKIACLTKSPQENGFTKQDFWSNRFSNNLYGRQF